MASEIGSASPRAHLPARSLSSQHSLARVYLRISPIQNQNSSNSRRAAKSGSQAERASTSRRDSIRSGDASEGAPRTHSTRLAVAHSRFLFSYFSSPLSSPILRLIRFTLAILEYRVTSWSEDLPDLLPLYLHSLIVVCCSVELLTCLRSCPGVSRSNVGPVKPLTRIH